jgi:chromosome partitioning protein
LIVSVFARMVANDANDQRTTMKTVAIISQKGGAGKTTIAIHLAVAAEKRGMKTALFDLDPQASASSWSDKRNKPSPAVVSAQAGRLPALLEQARAQSADLVIIDSAPNADAASLAAARAADLILVPCRPAAFDLNAIGTTLSLAVVAGKPAFVVLNAVPPSAKSANWHAVPWNRAASRSPYRCCITWWRLPTPSMTAELLRNSIRRARQRSKSTRCSPG